MAPALAPFGSQKNRRQAPHKDPRQHRQVQGCEDGARVEVDVLHRVAVAFSQKVTPSSLSALLLAGCLVGSSFLPALKQQKV